MKIEQNQKQSKTTKKVQQQKNLKPKPKWINPLRDRRRVIPFVVPTQEERLGALGSLAGEKWRIKKTLQAITNQFQPVPTPKPGDNLYQYEEDGQGFGLFASMYRNHLDKQQIIYVATFHCKLEQEALTAFKKTTKAFFHTVKVKVHKFPKNMDLKKFNPMISPQGDTYFDAVQLNNHFAKNLPKNCYSIAVITDLLLYNGDNPQQGLQEKWIFGLGSIKDRVSVISYSEIIKKGFDNKLDQQSLEKQYGQDFHLCFLQKVINHQLCHTFGMRHCIYYRCLMNGSNGYQQASGKIEHICPICLRKLQYAIGFDIVQRYDKLGDDKSLELAIKIREALGQK